MNYQQMMKEVLDCENVNFKLARSARSHIHRFLLILVSCQYNVVYIAPYHKKGASIRIFGWGGGGGGQKLKVKIFGVQMCNITFCVQSAPQNCECLIACLC